MDAGFLGEVAGAGGLVRPGSIHTLPEHLADKTRDAGILLGRLYPGPTSGFFVQRHGDVLEVAGHDTNFV